MKKLTTKKETILLTILFYLCLLFIPLFRSEGINITQTYASVFGGVISNLLLYVTPVVVSLYFIFSKNEITSRNFLFTSFIVILLLLINTEFSTSLFTFTFTVIAILIISAILINTDELLSTLILIPGIFMTKLGAVNFMFTVFFPVFLMMMIKNNKHESNTKKPSRWVTLGYLYFIVLFIIACITGKTGIDFRLLLDNMTVPDCISLSAGMLTVLFSAIIFLANTIPLTSEKPAKTRIAVLLFPAYVLIFSAVASVSNLLSENYRTVLFTGLIMMILGAVRVQSEFGNEQPAVTNKKIKNEFLIIITIALLCIAAFSHMYR